MKKTKIIKFTFYFTAAMLLFTQNCYAYIDPASTSYIIQIIAGIVIACGTAVGIGWNKLKRKFKKTEKDVEAPVKTADNGDENKVVTAEDLLDDDDE